MPYLAYKIVIPDSKTARYATDRKVAESLASYHCGRIALNRVLVPFEKLAGPGDEDWPHDRFEDDSEGIPSWATAKDGEWLG